MRIPFPVSRQISRWGSAVFAGLAAGGLAVLAGGGPPRPVLAALTGAAAMASAILTRRDMRLAAIARYPFRVLAAKHSVSFRFGPPRTGGVPLAAATVRSRFEIEALHPGHASVRLQKFVDESSALDAPGLLAHWAYACQVAPEGREARPATPMPHLSASRSLQLDVALPETPKPGARFTVAEEMIFEPDLESPARFVFQPSYPAGPQTVEVAFHGPRPLNAHYRIERGLEGSESGALVARDGTRLAFSWDRAEPTHQLVLDWDWDPESLPKPMTESERLIAEARRRQDELEKILATQFGEPETPSLPGESGFANEASADEHPIIKAAREREKFFKKD